MYVKNEQKCSTCERTQFFLGFLAPLIAFPKYTVVLTMSSPFHRKSKG